MSDTSAQTKKAGRPRAPRIPNAQITTGTTAVQAPKRKGRPSKTQRPVAPKKKAFEEIEPAASPDTVPLETEPAPTAMKIPIPGIASTTVDESARQASGASNDPAANPTPQIPGIPNPTVVEQPASLPASRQSEQINSKKQELVSQRLKFNSSVTHLIDAEQYVVLRSGEHHATALSPTTTASGIPLIFHPAFGKYEHKFRIGDVVKSVHNDGQIYSGVIAAIVDTAEKAAEQVRQLEALKNFVQNDAKRIGDKQPNKVLRDQQARQEALRTGTATEKTAAGTDSSLLPKVVFPVLDPAPPVDFGILRSEGVLTLASPVPDSPEWGFSPTPISATPTNVGQNPPVPVNPAATKKQGTNAGKQPNSTENPAKRGPGVPKKPTLNKTVNKASSSTVANADTITISSSQSSGKSDDPTSFVYPYTQRKTNKIRLVKDHDVFIDKQELASAVNRSKNRLQLTKALFLHLIGGSRGVKYFYDTKVQGQGVSKILTPMVKAISVYVHGLDKIGGIPVTEGRLTCLGQTLGAFIAHCHDEAKK